MALGLVMGTDLAEKFAFVQAVKTNASGGVERIVFLAFHVEEGQAECLWPILSSFRRNGMVPAFSSDSSPTTSTKDRNLEAVWSAI